MIESGLRALILISNLYLSLTFLLCTFSGPASQAFGLKSSLTLFVVTSTVAVLLSIFADTCVIFYFVGTGVWMRDRSEEIFKADRVRGKRMHQTYQLANKLKAKTMPFATFGIALALFAFILSGAYQTGHMPAWGLMILGLLWIINEWIGWRFHQKAVDTNLVYLDQVSAEIEAYENGA